MKYKVSRTSGSCMDEKQPCEEAFQEPYTYIEVRAVKSFEEFDKLFAEDEGKWMSEGKNHCVNKEGYIQREYHNYDNGWFIEVNSLEDLMNFNEKYGDIILRKCWDNENINEIEIYDSIRD